MMPESTSPVFPAHRFSIAPMLDWTDRHCRYFLRLLSRHTLLYTEMVTTGAIIHGKGDYLAYSEEEHPVALQLGGSDPQALAQCAKLARRAATMRSTSTSAAPPIACRTGCLAPA
jgi:tRNA-dihydrouridine synthase A